MSDVIGQPVGTLLTGGKLAKLEAMIGSSQKQEAAPRGALQVPGRLAGWQGRAGQAGKTDAGRGARRGSGFPKGK